jgi:hypothetical protein
VAAARALYDVTRHRVIPFAAATARDRVQKSAEKMASNMML